MGQQPGASRAARNRLGRQRPLRGLDVIALLFATPADVGRPFEDTDEQARRAVVEPLGHVGADTDTKFAAARAGLLRVREIKHFPLAGQIGATRPPAVAPALADHLGTGNFGKRRRRRFLGGSIEVEERRPFDALGSPAEGQTH
jgi:hypothetical protein